MSVCMVEYQGRCDEKKTAVGHSPKVLMEYYKILSDFTDVTIFAPRTILRSIDRAVSKNAKVLPCNIVMKSNNSLFTKINNKIHMFNNIGLALKNTNADIVWFFNVEFYFWLWIAFHKKSKKKIVCTSFIGGYQGGKLARIKQRIFEKAQKKVDVIISSGKEFDFKNCESVYIPDYMFSEFKYGKYIKNGKTGEGAVCLGTMGADKQLDEVVRVFSDAGYPLKIVGRFYDKDWPERLRKQAKKNVEIIDDYISEDEYYELLSDAKYCVLAYKPEKYGIQTSGVLQEAMFVGTIPIAYEEVLKASNVAGLGIDDWTSINSDFLSKENEKILSDMRTRLMEDFSEESVLKKYRDIFS